MEARCCSRTEMSAARCPMAAFMESMSCWRSCWRLWTEVAVSDATMHGAGSGAPSRLSPLYSSTCNDALLFDFGSLLLDPGPLRRQEPLRAPHPTRLTMQVPLVGSAAIMQRVRALLCNCATNERTRCLGSLRR